MTPKIAQVAKYADLYISKYVVPVVSRREQIASDWFEGLRLFFGKVFYRGRKDELSDLFYNRTLSVLEKHRTDLTPGFDQNWLSELLHIGQVNNNRDRRMVCEALQFMLSGLTAYSNNIVEFTIRNVKNETTSTAFNRFDNIYAIGDKLASLYIRDVVFI
jgi:hypothetical protein